MEVKNRKLPKKGTVESQDFLKVWDNSTSLGKKALCEMYHASYSRAKHLVIEYRDNPIEKVAYQDVQDMSWEDQLDTFKKMDRLVSLHHKVPTEVNIHYDTKKPIALVSTADWQLGQAGVDYDSFQEDMEFIRDEEGFYVDIGGDAWENIIQASKVGSSHNQIPIAPQIGLYTLTLKMLLKKINTVKTGNHQFWTVSLTGEDWLKEKARELKLIYTKHGARINLTVGDMTYPYASRHIGRFNSVFNPTHTNKQHQRMDFPWARFTVFEHHHVGAVEQYRYNDQECAAIRTGTYATYDDRAQ
uniref:Uncharacterized protein n=1 Tax=viral metagenome TaxID=1070528 RepID=A0A6M3LNW5_9ZZZZ